MSRAVRTNVLKALAAPLLVAVFLGGCYLPVRFDAEVEITRQGFYDLKYEGYLVSIPLYEGLLKGTLSPFDENEKVARLETDITRDSAVTAFQYIEKGHFKVRWEKSGDLLKVRTVTFLRRNENVLSLTYLKKSGTITVRGKSLSKSNIQRLRQLGLDVEGELRVRTDGNVIDHNATRVKGKKMKTYTWKIKSITDPTPRLTISLR